MLMLEAEFMTKLLSVSQRIWTDQEKFYHLLIQKETNACPDLLSAVNYQVLSPGKRIRATLPYLILTSLNSELTPAQYDSILWFGLAAELFHSATLCHDDVMDGDSVRRNLPTVWVKFGIPQAINAGDLLFSLADQSIFSAPISDDIKLRAIQKLEYYSRMVIYGQSMEISLRRDCILPDLSTYERIVFGKTGGLFSLCLIFAALINEYSESKIKAFHDFGMSLGKIFQLQDDLLDIIGDKGRGSNLNDLWEGKPSWLIAYCTQFLNASENVEFRQILFKPREEKNQSDISFINQVFDQFNVVNQGLEQLRNSCESLCLLIENEPNNFKQVLTDLMKLICQPIQEFL